MVKYLLKKSYLQKDLKEIDYKDLWNRNGVFTTMWILGKPQKIIFFNSHINNLIKSLKDYKIFKKNTKQQIIEVIKKNIFKKKYYNHLLRIALDKKIISISFRKRNKISKKFSLKPVNYKRIEPQYKNLKYKFILSKLSSLDVKKKDILLCVKGKVLETGTSNILLVSKNKIYSPINKFYRGNNLKFYEKKFNIIRKNVFIKDLNQFDEIILIGSGKGVVSVSSIDKLNWKRKNLIIYNKLQNIFNLEIKSNKYIFKI